MKSIKITVSNIGGRRPWIQDYSESHEYFDGCVTEDDIIKATKEIVVPALSTVFNRKVELQSIVVKSEESIWSRGINE